MGHTANVSIAKVGECLIWNGPVDRSGRPITHYKGTPIRVQHIAFQKKMGYAPNRIRMTCGHNLCFLRAVAQAASARGITRFIPKK